MDTSVWVRALAGKEFVYGELLIGDPGARAKTLTSCALFVQAPTVPHAEVASLVRARRLHGRGIGWIDAHLLASTMVSRSALYTADAPLRELAESLGVAYAH